MSAELALLPEPEETPLALPVALPPTIVAAIAHAAVEAYKQHVRDEEAAYQRAYYAANRERILEQQRLRRERKRPIPTRRAR